jgi:hypothetical protein
MAINRIVPVFAGLVGIIGFFAALPAFADDQTAADSVYAKRMFAANTGKLKNYACFVRNYDTQHLAQHPLQKAGMMKLLITAEKMDPDDKVLDYSFRLGVNFRDRAGKFDSSGDCGHAPTIKEPDNPDIPPEDRVRRPQGNDFQCNVDCDGGGVTVKLANGDQSVIVRLPNRIRIWKGNDPDEAARSAPMAGNDDKIFRLDRTELNACAILADDRKELAAMRHK